MIYRESVSSFDGASSFTRPDRDRVTAKDTLVLLYKNYEILSKISLRSPRGLSRPV